MIPNDQPLRKETLIRMLDALQRYEGSKWEENFIESVRSQFENKGDLSDRQAKIVEELYDKMGL